MKSRQSKSIALFLTTLVLLASSSACGDSRIMRKVFPNEAKERWERDSLLLADKPDVLFRLVSSDSGAQIVPMALIGQSGLKPAAFSAAGWRQFDRQYMKSGTPIQLFGNGQVEQEIIIERGMWEAGMPPLPGPSCTNVVPVAVTRALAGPNVLPALAGSTAPEQFPVSRIHDKNAIDKAMEQVTMLLAPGFSISSDHLKNYKKRIHQIPSGINGSNTLLMEFNDPVPVPDTLRPMGARARQLIVALDKGEYGFRPSYQFTTVGSPLAQPRLEFIDYLDIDADGVPEMFFGLQEREKAPWFTLVLRYEVDAWREVLRYTGNRCSS